MDYAVMAREAAQARWAALHEKKPWHDGAFENWVEEQDSEHPYHYLAGVTVWVASEELEPDNDWLQLEQWRSGVPASGGVGQPPPNTGPDDQ